MFSNTTVNIIDDDDTVRNMVTMLVQSAGHKAREFESARDYLKSELVEGPSCIILDVSMPGITGLELQQTLNSIEGRNIPIIFISGQADVPTSVKAMKAGALDFLPKPLKAVDLLACVERAFKKDVEGQKIHERETMIKTRYAALTPREKQVFSLVVKGLLNKQIGAELGIKEKTIKVHRGKVMEKMQAGSLAELVKFSTEVDFSTILT